MRTTLANVQSQVLALINAAASAPLQGVPVAVEAWNASLKAAINSALQTQGVAIAIMAPMEATRTDAARAGSTLARITVPVGVLWNPTQLASQTGLQRDPLAIVEAIFAAVVGDAATKGPGYFTPGETPVTLGEFDGGLLYGLEFDVMGTLGPNA